VPGRRHGGAGAGPHGTPGRRQTGDGPIKGRRGRAAGPCAEAARPHRAAASGGLTARGAPLPERRPARRCSPGAGHGRASKGRPGAATCSCPAGAPPHAQAPRSPVRGAPGLGRRPWRTASRQGWRAPAPAPRLPRLAWRPVSSASEAPAGASACSRDQHRSSPPRRGAGRLGGLDPCGPAPPGRGRLGWRAPLPPSRRRDGRATSRPVREPGCPDGRAIPRRRTLVAAGGDPAGAAAPWAAGRTPPGAVTLPHGNPSYHPGLRRVPADRA
jgi:hypothetical protein